MACTECRKAKRRCNHPQGQQKCDRCIKLSLSRGGDVQCIPHESRQGRRNDLESCIDSNEKCKDMVHRRFPGTHPTTSSEPCVMEIPCSTNAESIDTEIQILKDKDELLSDDAHEIHRGTDLSSSDINAEIRYDFNRRNKATCVSTYTRGGRSFFVVGDGTDIVHVFVKGRVKLPMHGRVTYIQSTCIVGLGSCCVGAEIMIQVSRGGPWKYAVVHALYDNTKDGIDKLEYYEWSGPVDGNGCPECFKLNDWDDMRPHFTFKTVNCDNVHDFHFVNQVRGPVPMGGSIRPCTRNDIDGGIQCSLHGPGRLKIPLPKFDPKLGNRLKDHSLSQEQTGQTDLLVENKSLKKKRKKILSTIPITEDKDVHDFYRPPRFVPSRDQLGLCIVVTNSLEEPITTQQAKTIPSELKSTLNFPSLLSTSNISSSNQMFYCLSQSKHNQLSVDYKDGLPVSDNYKEEVDDVLASYASNTAELLSLDKISRMIPRDSNESYHDYIRIFGGDGAPPVDNTFESFNVGSLVIHCKYVNARTYGEYVPLSIGFFHSPFQQLQIQPSFIEKIQHVLGKRGTYPNRNAVNISKSSHQSYVGERKSNKLSQPTVSEGPSSYDVTSDDHNYCFYKQSIGERALKLPFVTGLLNLLVSSTAMAPFYFYSHLARLFPKRNNDKWHIRFCSMVIVTISFCCSCHDDKNDLQEWALDLMVDSLKKIKKRFEELADKGVAINQSRLKAATEALNHVLWWGVSIPTTCCYQYIKKRNDIEVYQMFMCPGLGTCYRIQNYWIHIMLASLFSHCTSDAVYIVDARAYFGTCPEIIMFAWGA